MSDNQYCWIAILSDDTKIPFYTDYNGIDNPLTTVSGMDYDADHYWMEAPFDSIGPSGGPLGDLDHHPLASGHETGWLVKKSDVIGVYAHRCLP